MQNPNMTDDADINEKIGASFRGWLPKISKENEKAAWRHLFKTANLALHNYKTTVEQDAEMLQDDIENDTLSINERNCIQYRMNEKLILQFIKDTARKVRKLIKSENAKEGVNIIKKWREKDKECDKYIDYMKELIYAFYEGDGFENKTLEERERQEREEIRKKLEEEERLKIEQAEYDKYD